MADDIDARADDLLAEIDAIVAAEHASSGEPSGHGEVESSAAIDVDLSVLDSIQAKLDGTDAPQPSSSELPEPTQEELVPRDVANAADDDGISEALLLTSHTSGADGDEMEDLLEELNSRACSPDSVRRICTKIGVPDELRSLVWQVLLGVKRKTAPLETWDGELESENIDLIRKDIKRTRPYLQELHTPEAEADMELLLALYCRRKSVKYTQGLNEVLAPFLALGMGKEVAFNCFYAVVEKFLPNVFNDEFMTLQRELVLFRLLLQYHDPGLLSHLDQHGVAPEQYATPWFLTLFARGTPLSTLNRLWDGILLHGDPLAVYFVSVAMLVEHRTSLIGVDGVQLPAAVNQVTPSSPSVAHRIARAAHDLAGITATGFRRQAMKVSHGTAPVDHSALLGALRGQPAVEVSPADLLPILRGVGGASGGGSAVLVDTRSYDLYDQAHLPMAMHMPPEESIDDPEIFFAKLDGLAAAQGTAFVLIGSGPSHEDDTALQTALAHFLRKGFRRVTVLRGGFAALVEHLRARANELADTRIEDFLQMGSSRSRRSSSTDSAGSRGPFGRNIGSKLRDRLRVRAETKDKYRERFSTFSAFVKRKASDGVTSIVRRVDNALDSLQERAAQRRQPGENPRGSDARDSFAPVFSIDDNDPIDSAGSAQATEGPHKAAAASSSSSSSSGSSAPVGMNSSVVAIVARALAAGLRAPEDFARVSFGTELNAASLQGAGASRGALVECEVLVEMKRFTPCYLFVRNDSVMVLEAHASQLGVALVRVHRHIAELRRITVRKSQPGVTLFYFESNQGSRSIVGFRMRPEILQVIIRAVKRCLLRLLLRSEPDAVCETDRSELLGPSAAIAASAVEEPANEGDGVQSQDAAEQEREEGGASVEADAAAPGANGAGETGEASLLPELAAQSSSAAQYENDELSAAAATPSDAVPSGGAADTLLDVDAPPAVESEGADAPPGEIAA